MVSGESEKKITLNKVVIWGASISGELCYRKLQEMGVEVLFFVDRKASASQKYLGIDSHPVEFLLQYDQSQYDAIFLAMGAEPSGPKRELSKAKINKPVFVFRQGTTLKSTYQKHLLPYRVIRFDNDPENNRCLDILHQALCAIDGDIVIYGAGAMASELLEKYPELVEKTACFVDDTVSKQKNSLFGKRIESLDSLRDCGHTVFLCTNSLYNQHLMEARIRALGLKNRILKVASLLRSFGDDSLPEKAWGVLQNSIYPIEIPDIKVRNELDFALLDLPPRFYGMMPNGLGYVHNILESSGFSSQTLDLDIISYHRYHMRRILDSVDNSVTEGGYVMCQDPWSPDVIVDEWAKPEVVAHFDPVIDELIAELVRARPKIVGLSLHSNNLLISKEFVRKLRCEYPEVIVIVGGYDCMRADIGKALFPDFDYMIVFEAEMTLAPLVSRLLNGERPANLPGVVSRYDTSAFPFVPAPLFENLDSISFPKYQWVDVGVYQDYSGYQQTPLVLSRGCRWSKCTFCAERFAWRRRSPLNVVDEIEWLADRGRNNFIFNDSDLSGDPAAVRAICEEIIKRKITGISLCGQLRVQKGYQQEYFDVLHQAGFYQLTYGIDGWSRNTLKLHRKGYTIQMIEDVLKYTSNAGIIASMNLVVGIPHETEQDIDETIENIVKNKDRINGIENLNTLILSNGSIYWENPEKHGIRFLAPKEELYQKYIKMIPYEYWYSEDPYIDQDIRLARIERIVTMAQQEGVRIGIYSDWKLKKLKDNQRKVG